MNMPRPQFKKTGELTWTARAPLGFFEIHKDHPSDDHPIYTLVHIVVNGECTELGMHNELRQAEEQAWRFCCDEWQKFEEASR